jgi:hypothetical protein
MGKHTFSDAAGRRITDALMEEYTPGAYLMLDTVRSALWDEGFTGFLTQKSAMESLARFWLENGCHSLLLAMLDGVLRDVFEMNEGLCELKNGMWRLGIIPRFNEDAE